MGKIETNQTFIKWTEKLTFWRQGIASSFVDHTHAVHIFIPVLKKKKITCSRLRTWYNKCQSLLMHFQGLLFWVIAYILIGPCGFSAVTGHTHTGALLTAVLIVTLKIVEAHFAEVTVLSFYIFLQAWQMEEEMEWNDEKPQVRN